MYAAISRSKYVEKGIFKKIFTRDWKKILGKEHVIQELKNCDFSRIREESGKKKMTKREREEEEKIYGTGRVDGETRKIASYSVEPPGLFIGRGKNKNLGKVKTRIQPCNVTINIGRDVPIHPLNAPGIWKEAVHDDTEMDCQVQVPWQRSLRWSLKNSTKRVD